MTIQEQVESVINRIRPAIQQDGGDLELVGIVGGVVQVRLRGSCVGCPSSQITLKQGIERAIRASVPEISAVESVA
jgi:Fe-S cluster biogenesis protein NfuA